MNSESAAANTPLAGSNTAAGDATASSETAACDATASSSSAACHAQHTVSVVIPCYYSEKMIAEVVHLTRKVLVEAGYDYEFVLTNDGSTDGTFAEIEKLHAEDPKVIGINLAKNFGQHSAIMAGLRHATGDLVMLMDDDMQTHPSQCMKILKPMDDPADYDVVFATFPDHHEAWWRLLGSRFTDWSMRVLTKRPKEIKSSNFLVMRGYIAKQITEYTGPYVYIQGLLFRATNRMLNVPVKHFDREVGSSGYTLKSLIRLWSTVLNFSMAPLRFAAVIGAILGGLGVLGAILLIVQRVTDPTIQQGWSSLMVTMLGCSGIVVLFLGLIGEYLGRLFMTINKAPQYVLREVIGGNEEVAPHDTAEKRRRRSY
ncbi:MAG: glycosyltransferase family 2 protein [Eggerthellaceae bacterium]